MLNQFQWIELTNSISHVLMTTFFVTICFCFTLCIFTLSVEYQNCWKKSSVSCVETFKVPSKSRIFSWYHLRNSCNHTKFKNINYDYDTVKIHWGLQFFFKQASVLLKTEAATGVVLKIFAKLTGEHLCQSPFLIKLQAYLQATASTKTFSTLVFT